MKPSTSLVPLAPLAGAIVAGLFGRAIGRARRALGHHPRRGWSRSLASCVVFADVLHGNTFNGTRLHLAHAAAGRGFEIGFLIDRLTAMMMVVVTFVSLMVHIYTIGYMAEDPGYQRFFSYISLFTFSMLMLVMATTSCSCSSAGRRWAWCPTC